MSSIDAITESSKRGGVAMPSKAFVVNQVEAALTIDYDRRSEMVKLALPAGKYTLFASGTVWGSDRRPVHCFIETATTIVAIRGVTLALEYVPLPMPTMFGVLALSAADTVRVNCMVPRTSPEGTAAATDFRLMAVSVDAIG